MTPHSNHLFEAAWARAMASHRSATSAFSKSLRNYLSSISTMASHYNLDPTHTKHEIISRYLRSITINSPFSATPRDIFTIEMLYQISLACDYLPDPILYRDIFHHHLTPYLPTYLHPHHQIITTHILNALKNRKIKKKSPLQCFDFHTSRRSGATFPFDHNVALQNIKSHGLSLAIWIYLQNASQASSIIPQHLRQACPFSPLVGVW